MEQQAENKKEFLHNDRKLVCIMFIVYGLCILGLVAAALWGLDRRSKKLSADATSTAITRRTNNTATAKAVGTQQVRATATAVAHLKELAEYKFIDHFDGNDNDWAAGPQNDDYLVGEITVKDGVYLWDITEVKQTFMYWVSYPGPESFKDFDVYVDFKIVESKSDEVCSGLIFRQMGRHWEQGGYLFSVCNNSAFYVGYLGEDDKWQDISDWQYSPVIQPADWNRIEVGARGDHFTFVINNVVVFEATDNHQQEGELAIYLSLGDQNPVKVSFDNFGLQPR